MPPRYTGTSDKQPRVTTPGTKRGEWTYAAAQNPGRSGTNPWQDAGIPHNEAHRWHNNRFDLNQAILWTRLGVSPEEAVLSQQARGWARLGPLTTEEVQWWESSQDLKWVRWAGMGCPPIDAKQWDEDGWDPEMSRVWLRDLRGAIQNIEIEWAAPDDGDPGTEEPSGVVGVDPQEADYLIASHGQTANPRYSELAWAAQNVAVIKAKEIEAAHNPEAPATISWERAGFTPEHRIDWASHRIDAATAATCAGLGIEAGEVTSWMRATRSETITPEGAELLQERRVMRNHFARPIELSATTLEKATLANDTPAVEDVRTHLRNIYVDYTSSQTQAVDPVVSDRVLSALQNLGGHPQPFQTLGPVTANGVRKAIADLKVASERLNSDQTEVASRNELLAG